MEVHRAPPTPSAGRIDPGSVNKREELVALAAYDILGFWDIGRVDLRFDAEGRPHFLEVNPLLGLNPEPSGLCIMAGHLGVSHLALIDSIIGEAILRHLELA